MKRNVILFLILVILSSLGLSFSQDCPLELLGSSVWSDIEGIVCSGSRLYCAFTLGLGIYDVSIPGEPVLLGLAYAEGEGRRVAVSGNHAYLAAGWGGLAIVDVSRPIFPEVVSVWESSDIISGVVIKDHYAIVTGELLGIYIIDISDPAHPMTVTSHYLAGGGWDLTIQGDYLYVARGLSGMQIVDISDPEDPSNLGTYSSFTVINQIAVNGDYAYLAADVSGLIVLDVHDRAHPTETDRYESPSITVFSVEVKDNYVFTGCDNQGVQVFDVTHPSDITRLDWFSISGIGVRELALVSEDHLYASVTKGVISLDISDPSDIRRDGWDYPVNDLRRILVHDVYAFLVGRNGGIEIVFVGNPVEPISISNFNVTAIFRDVAIYDDYMYVASNNGMQIVDVTDITDPDYDTSYSSGSICYDIAIVDDIAYLTVDNIGVKRINISNPTRPTPMGEYNSPHARALVVTEDYFYFSDNDEGLYVINRVTMMLVGHYPLSGWSTVDMLKEGGLIFVAAENNGVYIFDVSNPADPDLITIYETEDKANGIAVDDGWLYIAENDEGLEAVYYADDLESPVSYGFYSIPGKSNGVTVFSNTVYLANEYGFLVFNNSLASIPEEPEFLPSSYYKLSAYPNPFNAETRLVLDLPGIVPNLNNEVQIYAITGHKITSLSLKDAFIKGPGKYELFWNGLDKMNRRIPAGVYLAVFRLGKYSAMQSIVLMK
ncbi:hypothetical protein JW877_01345 [bacterium]|nr:hypothetical protein [bacterium]